MGGMAGGSKKKPTLCHSCVCIQRRSKAKVEKERKEATTDANAGRSIHLDSSERERAVGSLSYKRL